ncbi:MAG: type II toxin-antitoxin system death-on-curing family toxin [Verrucomicrobiota bacterium]
MKEPCFLSVEQIEEIHREAIGQFGGTLGIRDAGTLESAVFHPQNVYFYGRGDLYDIAAAYAFHIAEAQAFLDGNKRAAVGAALTFLEGNGIPTDADSMPIYEAMIAIASKRISKSDLAALLRQLFPA